MKIRTFLTIVTISLSIGLFAQSTDSLGFNDDPKLNKSETELLNSLLREMRNDFDFSDKKVAFITGSNGGTIVSKSDYFKKSVIPWIENDSEPQISMVVLTESEKTISGEYDVLVLSWVKVFTPKTKEKVIIQLGIEK